MRRHQPNHPMQAARRERALQEPKFAAQDQPFEPVVADITVDRMLVLTGCGNDQVRQRGEKLERQFALRRGMLAAEHPDPGLTEQRFMNERLRYPPEAADGEIDAPG